MGFYQQALDAPLGLKGEALMTSSNASSPATCPHVHGVVVNTDTIEVQLRMEDVPHNDSPSYTGLLAPPARNVNVEALGLFLKQCHKFVPRGEQGGAETRVLDNKLQHILVHASVVVPVAPRAMMESFCIDCQAWHLSARAATGPGGNNNFELARPSSTS